MTASQNNTSHNDSQTKTCMRCGERKPLDAFYTTKRADGTVSHRARCKKCMRVENNKRQEKKRRARGVKPRKPRKYASKGKKFCARCEQVLSVNLFGKHKGRKDGLSVWCKKCNLEYSKTYRADDPERRKAYDKAYYERNKEKLYWDLKAWREANPEKHLAQIRKFNEENRERRNAQARLRNRLDPEKQRNKKHRRRALENDVESGFKLSLQELLESQNGLCAGNDIYSNCEQSNKKIPRWTVDHIIPLSRGGPDIWWNTQAMCRSCNSSKHDKTMEEWIEWVKSVDG